MASYADIDAMKDFGFIPIEDIDAIHSERATVIPRLIASVSGRIDSYLRKSNKPPLVEPYPEEVVWAVCAIVSWQLVSGKRGVNVTDSVAEEIKAEHDRAQEWIKDLARNEAELDYAADQSPGIDEGGPQIGSLPAGYQYVDAVQSEFYGDSCGCGGDAPWP